MLSAVLGLAGALGSVNYALGGRQKLVDQLARLGTNVLNVSPETSRSVAGRARTGGIVTTLTPADYQTIRRELPLFAYSSGIFTRVWLIKAADLAKNNCTVVGVEPDYMAIKAWPIRSGRLFDQTDLRRLRRVAVLGYTVAQDLFGGDPPAGARVTINRVPFEVLGVMSERGQGLDAGNEDDRVYVPLSTAMRRLANVDYLSGIVFSVARWNDMDRATLEVRGLLQRRHIRVGKLADDFQVQNQKQLIETRIAASDRLLFFVRWIALSALAVSGLGVLAIAWIGVKERTREIGTRRAVGATRSDIFIQILGEALLLSTAGCFIGLAIAKLSSPTLARWANQPNAFDPSTAWLGVGCSIALSVLFALIPARTAARANPIEAIRFE